MLQQTTPSLEAPARRESDSVSKLILELRQDYVLELPKQIQKIENALEDARNGQEAQLQMGVDLVHRMHGTAGTLGLDELAQRALDLEMYLDRTHLDEESAWQKADALFSRLMESAAEVAGSV